LMYPAAKHNVMAMMTVIVAFGVTTILTMIGGVLLGVYGLNFISLTTDN